MAILVDENTKVLVQGMTGRSGTFYTDMAMRYGSNYVAGVRPGKGGSKHLGLPVFDTVAEAVSATGANASMVMVPAHHAAEAILEGIEAGLGLIVCVTERVPQHDMRKVKAALANSDTVLIGPNSQGILAPDVAKIGVMSTRDAVAGSVGIVSRSASLTSEIVAAASRAGLGQSSTVGVGGDAVHGIGFVDCLKLFKDDAQTSAVVLIGEIGGREEEDAAAYLAADPYGKPVIALVVGRHAPQERRMGHAGTLSIFGAETAGEKMSALEAAGVMVAQDTDAVIPLVTKALA